MPPSLAYPRDPLVRVTAKTFPPAREPERFHTRYFLEPRFIGLRHNIPVANF